MSKISLENSFNASALKRLIELGYPDCHGTPLTIDEIKKLKIGTACYVATLQSTFKLAMFAGYSSYAKEFCFYCSKGAYWYKERNAGKTYNVFLANMEV